MEDIAGGRVHISVHIEGTTNTSFLAELGNIYGAEHVLVYQLAQKRFLRLSDLPYNPAASLIKIGKDLLENAPLISQIIPDNGNPAPSPAGGYSRKELPPDTAVVYGHFTPNLFRGIFDNPFISIILKDPLERMITSYKEWKGKQGIVDWRATIPYKKNITFRDFALREEFINFQSKSLGSKRLGDYDLVGVTECQASFIAQLRNKDWTGYVEPLPKGYPLEKSRYKNLGITQEFLEEFQSANQLDYSIYQQAKEFMGYC
ncbi:MAG TPA: hypothetical protein ENG59_06015 [Chloroflexi bacterium]|nr:MAG: hypothetical protein DRI46_07535 [Chloroflexota bacterium]HDD55777.1 hypothetical protein [Chloroflexota bacterium]